MADIEETTNEASEVEAAPKPKAKRRTVAQIEEDAMVKARAEVAGEGTPEGGTPPGTFRERLLALQIAMADVAGTVRFDKVVSNISHEYADTQQYKAWLSLKCSQLGLIFGLDILDTEYLGVVAEAKGKSTSYGTKVCGNAIITDSMSEASVRYGVSGIGVNVQPGYCLGGAQTNALRNFILNSFLLDNMGRDGDDVGMCVDDVAKKGYVSPDEKATMKHPWI